MSLCQSGSGVSHYETLIVELLYGQGIPFSRNLIDFEQSYLFGMTLLSSTTRGVSMGRILVLLVSIFSSAAFASACQQANVEALVRGVAISGNTHYEVQSVEFLNVTMTKESRPLSEVGNIAVEAWHAEVNLHTTDGQVYYQSFEAVFAVNDQVQPFCHFSSISETWTE